jgi:hypothetical protein
MNSKRSRQSARVFLQDAPDLIRSHTSFRLQASPQRKTLVMTRKWYALLSVATDQESILDTSLPCMLVFQYILNI